MKAFSRHKTERRKLVRALKTNPIRTPAQYVNGDDLVEEKINIVDDDVRRSKLQDLRSKPVSSLCDESAFYPSTYFSALQFEAF